MFYRFAFVLIILLSCHTDVYSINLTDAIDVVRAQGVQIIYSNENLNTEEYYLDIDKNTIDVSSLKYYLSTINFDLLQLKNNLYVIKLKKTNDREIDSGLVALSLFDDELQTKIYHAEVKVLRKPNKLTYLNGSVYTITGLKAKKYSIEISANGYDLTKLDIDLSNTNLIIKDVYLHRLPLSLDNVLVTTSQYDLQVEKTNNPLIIYSDELKATPNIGNDPSRAIAKLPGLTGNGISARHYVRGGKLDESGIILNGLSLKDPYHFKDFFAIFSIIDLSYTEEVSLYTGVFPAKYGHHISSVMTINSMKASRPLFIDASLGVFNSHLTLGGQFSPQTNYIASIRSGGDLFHSNLLEVNAGKPKYDDGFISLTHVFNNDTEVQANLLFSRDRINIDISSEDEFANAQYQDKNIWVSVKNNSLDNMIINTQIYYQANHTDRKGNLNDEEITGTLIENQKALDFGLSVDLDMDVNENMVFSIGGQWSDLKNESFFSLDKQSNDFITLLLDLDTDIQRNHRFDNSGNEFSVYGNIRYQITPSLIADFGIRYDQQSWIEKKQLSPRINFSYFYDKTTTLRLGIGRHQQTQELDDLLFEDEMLDYFKPEIADVMVLEASKEFDKNTSIRAEIYYKNYKHVHPYYENLFIGLHLHPELFSDRVRISPESAVAKGIDVTYSKTYESLKWSIGYSFASIKDVINGVAQHRSWDQKNGIKFNIDWRYKKWDLSTLLIYHSGWPRTIISDNGTELSISGRNDNRNEDLLNLDLRAAYNFKIKSTDSSFWVQISNALDRDNQCCSEYAYDQDESGQLVLTDESIRWLPFIPTLGFNIYFD